MSTYELFIATATAYAMESNISFDDAVEILATGGQ